MKRFISIFLILTLCFLFASCTTKNIQYKTITFKHSGIMQDQLELTIPNDWIYEEVRDGDNLIKSQIVK